MIVGCYDLHLYCDGNCREEGRDQFTGETASECRARARKKGWKFDLRNGYAYCPKCSSKKEQHK